MMRSVIGVCCFLVSGFLFYMVGALAFVSEPSTGAKWGMGGRLLMLAFFFLCLGLAVGRFQNWKRNVGIVLTSSSVFTAFLVFTFACILLTPEFQVLLPPEMLSKFSDYTSGFGVIVALACVGLLLIWKDHLESKSNSLHS